MFGRKKHLLDIYEVAEMSTKAILNSKKIDKAIRIIEKNIKEKAKEGKWELKVSYGYYYGGFFGTTYRPGYTTEEAKCIIQILENGGYKVKMTFEPRDGLENCYKVFTVSWEHMKPRDVILN